jgi:basic membrane protein A
MKKLMLTIAVASAFASSAALANIKPAVVYDFGGKNDGSFNEGTFNGVTKFSKETGIKINDFESSNEAQFAQVHRRFAQKKFNPILAVGFTQAQALTGVAKQFPKTQFGIIDSVIDLPNVESIVFKEQEGAFLVGMLAAMKSKTSTVGFIGGMDIPLIRAFSCGFEQGAHFVNPDIKFVQNMVGTTGSAWNNPVRGGQIAQTQMDQGADVVFAAAGNTGRGVLAAMAKAKKYGIGVDSNQNALEPGYVLTSMLKRVDVAAYLFLKEAQNANGKISGGIKNLGLAEGGVDWALDKNNRALITAKMEKDVNATKQLIIDGKVSVHDYRDNGKCVISSAQLSTFIK